MHNDDIEIRAESSFIDPAVKSKKQLIDWILTSLGHPLVTVELTEAQLNLAIQNALEKYTKYAYFGDDKYLVVDMNKYEHGKGLDLRQYNIAAVKDISLPRDNAFSVGGDLFWGPYAFLGQGNGIYPAFHNNGATPTMGNWVTWQAVTEFFDLTKRMTGSNPDFTYSKETGYMILMPEPRKYTKPNMMLLTCQCVPPYEVLYGNEYVKRLALAQAKMLLGIVRKKFSGVQLPGGGQIDTTIGDEGKQDWDKLIEDIIKDEAKGQCFCVV